ncbi:protein-disulfide reductase DsbD [Marinomonas sp. A79]|uniref:Protein-disulfide reductase DsbD n=1 Tax=Marinomonas vulgaris TaxID=2823372 RepID=A0ABS5HBG0_9GAMM|nr:protein-disulfide reductase DsbD [Marinomonas vulgaris]MBR7888996.1 protein-disulfide reductase DsbD [Marinomonas vulgaris]
MRLFVLLLLLTCHSASYAFTFGATSAFSEPDFLPVEQVFKPYVANPKEGRLQTTWQIEDGYYLYQEQFSITGPDANHLHFSAFPPGEINEDPYYGKVKVFRNELVLTLYYDIQLPPGTPINANLSYQGCADRGLCYAPQSLPIQFSIPALSDASMSPNSNQPSFSKQPTITNNHLLDTPSLAPSEAESVTQLLSSNDVWSTLLVVFGLGLLLSLTPCVLPMVPIVSAIVVGTRNSRLGALYYSSIYVLGMALTYAAIGGLVGLFGTQLNLQAQLQNPILLAISALLFVLLALAMFGFYELKLPSSWQQKLQMSNTNTDSTWQTSLSVFVAGVLSTLIVSPCVSAPLAGALLYISGQGDAWYGAGMLFVMALGMGIPLLMVGLFGPKILPKNGEWLNDIKVFMGFGLLAMAVWLITRWLPLNVHLYLWALLALMMSSYFFHRCFSTTSHPVRWFFALGLFLLACVEFVGGATGSHQPMRPLMSLSAPTASTEQETELFAATITSLDELEQLVANDDERLIMLDFYADWCVSCKVLEEMFLAADVRPLLEKVQLVRVDVTDNSADNKAIMQAFAIFGPPSLIFLDQQGQERKALSLMGEPSKADLVARLTAHITP